MPSNSVVAAGSPCVTTLTEVLQPLPPHTEGFGQAAQQISSFGVEHIKSLIEKMANVQKVNQLVILGLDHLPLHAQSAGMQQPQGLIQPLHFDFTQPIVQQDVLQQAGGGKVHEGTVFTEQATLLQAVEVELAVEQTKALIECEATIATECPENQVTLVESDRTEAQVNEVQYELLPVLNEKDILPAYLEASHQLVLTTEEQQIQDAIDIETPGRGNVSSLTVITDCELLIKPTDITLSEVTNTDAEPCLKDTEAAHSLMETETQTVQGNQVNPDMTNSSADPLSHRTSEALGLLVEPEPLTEQGSFDELDKTNANPKSRCQKSIEATDLLVERQPNTKQRNPNLDSGQEIGDHLEQEHLKEILSSEDQILQINGNIQHDQERYPLEQAPCSESGVQQSRVDIEDQTLLTEESLYVKKALPVKKKRSKKQVIPKSQYIETQDEVTKSTLPIASNQRIETVSKTSKKQKRAKKLFGSKQNKKKCSKAKLLNISKNSLHKDHQDINPENVPFLPHSEVEMLKQKHKKGRKAKKSSGLIQALNIPSEKVLKVSEQVHRGKPQKRKFENQRDLVKKGKSTQETQQDETPVLKKKKPGKMPEATQKKAKTKITVNKVSKKSHQLAKQKVKDKNVSETPIIDQIKQQALLLLKGHKQPQLKVHKLDAKTTGLDHQLVHKCQTKEIDGYTTTVEPAKKGIQNKSLKAPSQKKNKAKTMRKKSKVDSKQSSPLQTSPIQTPNKDLPSVKQKVVRKRKASAKLDQEIALSPPNSRLIIGCHDCGKSFSEVSALQEHMASMHSESAAPQSVVPYDSEMPRNEMMFTNVVHSSSFEINVPTDWDLESEMREIGLGNEQRIEHRLSFPALNPSPSFPLTATFVGGQGKEDDALNQEPSLGPKNLLITNSTGLVKTNETNLGEQENIDVYSPPPVSLSEPQESMEIKEPLKPSDVNLDMANNQNDKGSYISANLYSLSQNNSHTVSDQEEEQASHNALGLNTPFIQSQLPTKPVNPASTCNDGCHSTERSEIKQETGEASVQTPASQTNTSVAKGKRGRGSKGRGKRQLGKRRSAESRQTEEMVANEEDCQVVFELYSLTGNSEEKNEEVPKSTKAVNAIAASIPLVLKESVDVQEVHVLPQPVTPDVLEMVRSDSGSSAQKTGEHDKNSSLSSSQRKGRISVHCQSEMRAQVGFY